MSWPFHLTRPSTPTTPNGSAPRHPAAGTHNVRGLQELLAAHLIFGSHTLWNDLLAGGLIDELHIMIGPALLGAGTPAFEGRAPMSLRLLDSRTLEDSELVLTRYGVHHHER
jgi:dihydrofolate reductase